MNQVNFTDWQEFSLKKDVEKIAKEVKKEKKAIYCVVWEAIVFFFTFFLDHFFEINSEQNNCSLYITWIVLAVSPFVVSLLIAFIKFLSRLVKAKKGYVLTSGYVDIFDNQICYWVMIGRSYNEMLSTATDVSKIIFYYQEASYYINKAIFELYKMAPVITKAFSDDIDKVKKEKVISISRLINVIQLILDFNPLVEISEIGDEVYIKVNNTKLKGHISHKKIVKFQKEIDEKYRNDLSDFLKQVQHLFSDKEDVKLILRDFINILDSH